MIIYRDTHSIVKFVRNVFQKCGRTNERPRQILGSSQYKGLDGGESRPALLRVARHWKILSTKAVVFVYHFCSVMFLFVL